MLTIVLAVILGLGFTWIASQNPAVVPLNFFGTVISLPIYVIGAASFLLGILITSIFGVFDWTAESIRLSKREHDVSKVVRTNESLNAELQKIKEENLHLKEELDKTRGVNRERVVSQRRENVRGFFNRVFHPNSVPPEARV